MKEWYLSREPRERFVLALGAAVAVIIVAYGLVWRPLTNGTAELRADVDGKSRLLVDLHNAAAVAPLEDGVRPPSDQSLMVLVDRTARGRGIAGALVRTRQDGATGLNVTFQEASFDQLLGWLVTLESEHGVSVESASVTSRAPGVVNGQIMLRRY